MSMKIQCCKMALAAALTVGGWNPAGAAETTSAAAEPASAKPARKAKAAKHEFPTIGSVERLDPALDQLIPADAKIEMLASGFQWSEGPVWIKKGGYLLFSDVPRNVVFKWQEGQRTSDYLIPSGYTESPAREGESGSNGLTLDSKGNLILAQHGDRRVARLGKGGQFETLAQFYKYRRFNSPNDLVFKSNGDLYFTDPPYGLRKLNDDPAKELFFNGVYRLTPKGEVTLLDDQLTFPNGIAFSPDEKTLYVAISDSARPVIVAYDVGAEGLLANKRVFFDAAPLAAQGRPGLPDGLKVDLKGNVFATGPGGVLVIAPDGRHLGTILTGKLTANCGWGNDGSVLYMTAHDTLCRIQTSTRGRIP